MNTAASESRTGDLVAGRYRLDDTLAEGGMGLLFAATDTRTHKPVVVKVLKPEYCADALRVQRFLREMRVTAELRHPHIVDVLDLGTDDNGVPYLVMERLQGLSLGQELEQRLTPMSPQEILEVVLPILRALERVQRAGVVHRDIKPDNIFLARDAHGHLIPKLLDFGIAKLPGSNAITHDGFIGTPLYMSPEQASGKPCGPAADVWAMGVLMWHCAMGYPPFGGATPAEVGAKVLYEGAPRLVIQGVKRSFVSTIERALVRDLTRRYSDASALLAALLSSAADAGIEVPAAFERNARENASTLTADDPGWSMPPNVEPVWRKRWVVAAALGMGVALGMGALWHNRELDLLDLSASTGDAALTLAPETLGTRSAPLHAAALPTVTTPTVTTPTVTTPTVTTPTVTTPTVALSAAGAQPVTEIQPAASELPAGVGSAAASRTSLLVPHRAVIPVNTLPRRPQQSAHGAGASSPGDLPKAETSPASRAVSPAQQTTVDFSASPKAAVQRSDVELPVAENW